MKDEKSKGKKLEKKVGGTEKKQRKKKIPKLLLLHPISYSLPKLVPLIMACSCAWCREGTGAMAAGVGLDR